MGHTVSCHHRTRIGATSISVVGKRTGVGFCGCRIIRLSTEFHVTNLSQILTEIRLLISGLR